MDLTDESWSAVRHTPSVTGFVGHSHQPVPLSLEEVENMLAPAVQAEAEAAAAPECEWRRPDQDRLAPAGRGRRLRRLRLGDGRRRSVRHAARDDHRDQRRGQRVKALVEIFGRETPVELSFTQIQKV